MHLRIAKCLKLAICSYLQQLMHKNQHTLLDNACAKDTIMCTCLTDCSAVVGLQLATLQYHQEL